MNYIGRVTGENFNGDFLKKHCCMFPWKNRLEVRKNMKTVVMSIDVLQMGILIGFKGKK